jgi:hypothetical protein
VEWFKASTGIHDDPDIKVLSDKAFRYWVEAMSWAGRWESDGNIRLYGELPDYVQELVDRGRLVLTEDEGIYHIAGWLKWQKSKAQLDELRSKRSSAGKRGALAKQTPKQVLRPTPGNTVANAEQTSGNPLADLEVEREIEEPKPPRPASADDVKKLIAGLGDPVVEPTKPNDRQRYFVERLRTIGWDVHPGIVQRLNRTFAKAFGERVGMTAVIKALEFAWEEKVPAPDNPAAYLTTRARSYLEKFQPPAEVSA